MESVGVCCVNSAGWTGSGCNGCKLHGWWCWCSLKCWSKWTCTSWMRSTVCLIHVQDHLLFLCKTLNWNYSNLFFVTRALNDNLYKVLIHNSNNSFELLLINIIIFIFFNTIIVFTIIKHVRYKLVFHWFGCLSRWRTIDAHWAESQIRYVW